jgi:hypothetical protein
MISITTIDRGRGGGLPHFPVDLHVHLQARHHVVHAVAALVLPPVERTSVEGPALVVLHPQPFRELIHRIGVGQLDAEGIAGSHKVAQRIDPGVRSYGGIQVPILLRRIRGITRRDLVYLALRFPAHALAVPGIPRDQGAVRQAHIAPTTALCHEILATAVPTSSARMEIVAPIEQVAELVARDVEGGPLCT